jgi:predicted site-specific integrase-resolvase
MPVSREAIEQDFPPDRGEILTSDELADRLKAEAITIRRWAAAAKIPAGRLPSGEYRFFWPDVFASIMGLAAGRDAIKRGSPWVPAEILTSDELADRLKAKALTIRQWAAAAKIPAGRVPSGEYRFFWPDVFASIFPAHDDTTGAQHEGGRK